MDYIQVCRENIDCVAVDTQFLLTLANYEIDICRFFEFVGTIEGLPVMGK